MRICSVNNQARAGLIINMLSQEDVHPRPLNTSAHISIGGADRCYYIEVPEDEAEKARSLLIDMGFEKDLVQ